MEHNDIVEREPTDLQSIFESSGLPDLPPFGTFPSHTYPPSIYVDTSVPPYSTNQYPWDTSPVSTDPRRSSGYDVSSSASGRSSFQFPSQVIQSPAYSSTSSGNQPSPQLLPGSPLTSPSSPHGSHPQPSGYSQILIPTARRSVSPWGSVSATNIDIHRIGYDTSPTIQGYARKGRLCWS
jgi:hypothetical protein